MKELRKKRKYSIPGAMREDLTDKSGSLLNLEVQKDLRTEKREKHGGRRDGISKTRA